MKLKENKPEIRFPEFTDEWEQKPLNKYLSESKAENTDLKFDKTQVLSVSGELGIVNQIEHLGRSYAGESVHNYGVVETGDIVYTKSPLKANPYGIIKLNKGKAGIVSTLYAVYKVKQENAIGEFLDHYFSSDENTNRYLRPLVKKGAKNDMKINNAYVLHDKIFAPSVAEQKRIGTFLSVVNERLAQFKEKKSLLEEYKKGVMQKLFSQELRFKNENGDEFPKWDLTKLNEIAISIHSGKDKISIEGAFPLYGSIGIIGKNPNFTYDGKFILIARVGANAGTINVVNGKFCVSDNTLVFINKEEINIDFCYYLLINQNLNKLAFGSGQPLITGGIIKSLIVGIPSIAEQSLIANFLSAIDKMINNCQSQIEQIKEHKKGLIQKMFCA